MSSHRKSTDRLKRLGVANIPAPPSSPLHVSCEIVPFGETWARVHSSDRTVSEFHPNIPVGPKIHRGRFNPFMNSDGDWVPTLYASSNYHGAFFETVLSGAITGKGVEPVVSASKLVNRMLGRIDIKDNLILAKLNDVTLGRYGINEAQLLGTPEAYYEQTTEWAKAFYESNEVIHGLFWLSARCDGTRSIVLFGDRVKNGMLSDHIQSSSVSLSNGEGFKMVKQTANKYGIRIGK